MLAPILRFSKARLAFVPGGWNQWYCTRRFGLVNDLRVENRIALTELMTSNDPHVPGLWACWTHDQRRMTLGLCRTFPILNPHFTKGFASILTWWKVQINIYPTSLSNFGFSGATWRLHRVGVVKVNRLFPGSLLPMWYQLGRIDFIPWGLRRFKILRIQLFFQANDIKHFLFQPRMNLSSCIPPQ